MNAKINKIIATSEKKSARGGLSLILKYIENIKRYELINSVVIFQLFFGNKGLGLQQFLKQIFAYFIDGTDMLISGFDNFKVTPKLEFIGVLFIYSFFIGIISVNLLTLKSNFIKP